MEDNSEQLHSQFMDELANDQSLAMSRIDPQRDSGDGVEDVGTPPVSGGSAAVHAFQMVKVAADTLCVRKGTVNTEIPTIGIVALDVDHTENELSIPGTGTREYWLKITRVEGGAVTAVTIEESEPDNVSATQAEILLGSVETDSGDIVTFISNLSGSQALASCGANHFFGVV